MIGDGAGPRARMFAAVVVLYLRNWAHGRGVWVWLALLAVWGWWEWEMGGPASQSPWWSKWVVLGALTGFLAGYDTFIRLREDGSLRLLLLQPPPRGLFAAATLAGGVLVAWTALLLFLVFLVVIGHAPGAREVLLASALVALGSAGFVAYAQAGSLVLPRDAAGVLGLFLLVAGGGPLDRWLPAGGPAWLAPFLEGAPYLMPTVHRLESVLAGTTSPVLAVLVVLAQVGAAVLVAGGLLRRPALLRRSDAP